MPVFESRVVVFNTSLGSWDFATLTVTDDDSTFGTPFPGETPLVATLGLSSGDVTLPLGVGNAVNLIYRIQLEGTVVNTDFWPGLQLDENRFVLLSDPNFSIHGAPDITDLRLLEFVSATAWNNNTFSSITNYANYGFAEVDTTDPGDGSGNGTDGGTVAPTNVEDTVVTGGVEQEGFSTLHQSSVVQVYMQEGFAYSFFLNDDALQGGIKVRIDGVNGEEPSDWLYNLSNVAFAHHVATYTGFHDVEFRHSGVFELEVRGDDFGGTFNTATPIGDYFATSGSISSRVDDDTFALFLNEGETLNLYANVFGIDADSINLTIRSASGDLRSFENGNVSVSDTFTANASGVYFIEVGGYAFIGDDAPVPYFFQSSVDSEVDRYGIGDDVILIDPAAQTTAFVVDTGGNNVFNYTPDLGTSPDAERNAVISMGVGTAGGTNIAAIGGPITVLDLVDQTVGNAYRAGWFWVNGLAQNLNELGSGLRASQSGDAVADLPSELDLILTLGSSTLTFQSQFAGLNSETPQSAVDIIRFSDGREYNLRTNVEPGTDQDDIIFAVSNEFATFGEGGNDGLFGSFQADRLEGGAGHDSMTGSAGNDTLLGGTGNDLLFGDQGSDTLAGGDGTDDIRGGSDNDALYGNDGNDTLRGDEGDDNLSGGNDNDLVVGNDGDDTLRGGNGDDRAFGGEHADIVSGNDGDDTLNGGIGDDRVFGGSDNDTVQGGSGNDLVNGGNGADLVQGDAGDDTLLGANGADTLAGGDGLDDLRAGDGDDQLFGNNGDDTLRGEDGNDNLSGGNGNDLVVGNDGSDTLRGGNDEDVLFGGEGLDVISGNQGEDTLNGGAGDDRLFGGTENDLLDGGGSNDLVNGGSGDDLARGNTGDDTLIGGQGQDSLSGGDGQDDAYGGDQDDQIYGNNGEDTLRGEGGDDTLSGGNGDDIVAGNDGNDALHGGNGQDRLIGGFGSDTLTGNQDADAFVFSNTTASPHSNDRDTIKDFETGIDVIDLSGFADTLSFVAAYTGSGNEVRYNGSIGRLYIDVDGDQSSDFSIDITGAPTLTITDLIL